MNGSVPPFPEPLLALEGITVRYGRRIGCLDVSLQLFPGEVVAVVGESGSGKTTLLRAGAGLVPVAGGGVVYRDRTGRSVDVVRLSEADRRHLARFEWGFVHQDAADGLRLNVSAGANVGERLMANGHRNYAQIRAAAAEWLRRVEIDRARIDELPSAFSGGMRQRLQIACNLVTGPRLLFLDEPTGGLDVSVQARLLDTLRRLVGELGVAAVLVTHDLGVARLLADRMVVMKAGRVVEEGLTDQVLEDPQHPYTQLLVSAILPA